MRPLPLLFLVAGCTLPAGAPAHLTGSVDPVSLPGIQRVRGTSDDGLVVDQPLSDGAFRLGLEAGRIWDVALVDADGGTVAVALPRPGHFDRGVDVEGPVDDQLGTLFAPAAGTIAVLPEQDLAQCPTGALPDGGPCTVDEALTACADGPQRPMDDPTDLLLGTGTLADLPGASRGVRYAVPSRVPVPVLFACTLTPTSPP